MFIKENINYSLVCY